MGTLDGKVAMVTGAGRDQGRAHALTLARAGADVVVIDIADQIETVEYPLSRSSDLEQTRAEVEGLGRRVVAVEADVRSQEQLDGAVALGVDQLGGIDILIANAGIFGIGPFWELSDQQWDDMVDVNLSGMWRSAKAVAPHMIERRSGSIVMTASINGLEPSANYAHYTTSKHGVIGLMKCVALELAPYRVRCNAICPGAVDTGMVNWQGLYDAFAGHEDGSREDLVKNARNLHALQGQGLLEPQMIADAALWLVSETAAAVTGVALPVDGGHMILPGFNHEATA